MSARLLQDVGDREAIVTLGTDGLNGRAIDCRVIGQGRVKLMHALHIGIVTCQIADVALANGVIKYDRAA